MGFNIFEYASTMEGANVGGGMESVRETSMMVEALILEHSTPEELREFLSNSSETKDAIKNEILTERTIVRLDKKARFSRGLKMECFAIAKKKKDPKFLKLLTIWRMERMLEEYIVKKYSNQARPIAKANLNKIPAARSAIIKKAINGAKAQFNSSPTGGVKK